MALGWDAQTERKQENCNKPKRRVQDTRLSRVIHFRYKYALMEFRHLRYFIAVAEELNFTRAAERLHIAQPPLSRQIQQLEEEIGVQLLTRNRRRVVLTSAGQTFLVDARKLITQAEAAVNNIRPQGDRASGTVRVGLAAGLGEKISPSFTTFARKFPHVDVQCNDILSSLQNEALRDRVIDIGFLRPPIDPRYLTSEYLFDQPFTVLVARANPLSRKKFLRISDLERETLLLHERRVSTGIYDRILEIYRKAHVNPIIVHTNTGPYEEAGTMLVARNKGIFLVGGVHTHRAFEHEVTTVPLKEPDAFFEVHVACRKGESSPSVLAFLETVRGRFKMARARRD
jgi:DNA-binding transcriptional LysR family regulator